MGKGVYTSKIRPLTARTYRLGFAVQTDSEFCREVTASVQRAAAREQLHLITVNNRYSAREALRNADLLIRERVDLVLEFQTYERVAPIIASKFLGANIPVIAIEIPHPGATYFGADNYQAGSDRGQGARADGPRSIGPAESTRCCCWSCRLPGLCHNCASQEFWMRLRKELPAIAHSQVVHLDGKGDFEQILDVVRRFLRRSTLKRTLVGAVNDMCALAALRAFEEAGGGALCAVMGQNAIREARQELRRPGTRLIGSIAYFPERYGDELIPLSLGILQKKPTPAAVFVKHQLITPNNVRLIYPLDP